MSVRRVVVELDEVHFSAHWDIFALVSRWQGERMQMALLGEDRGRSAPKERRRAADLLSFLLRVSWNGERVCKDTSIWSPFKLESGLGIVVRSRAAAALRACAH